MKTGPVPKTREEAWQHLKQTARVTETGCWLIEYGASVGIGYKLVRAGNYEWYAHHFAHFMENGPVPLGTVRRHTCDQPNCINPEHIIAGTHADNVADKVSKNRHCYGTKHYRSRLTEEQVYEILASQGKTYAELSQIYGVSRGGIHNIKTGVSWKHCHTKYHQEQIK